MKTEIIALYLGTFAVCIPLFISLFRLFKSLVDKECPLDNCKHCGRETYKGVCLAKCQPDSRLKANCTTPDIRPDFNEWMEHYNHPLLKHLGK